MVTDDADREQILRDKAVRRLKKQRDFGSHLLVYVLVNTLLVVIWVMTDPHGRAGSPYRRQVKMIWPPAAMA
jgi:hypothetical protein